LTSKVENIEKEKS